MESYREKDKVFLIANEKVRMIQIGIKLYECSCFFCFVYVGRLGTGTTNALFKKRSITYPVRHRHMCRPI